MKEQSNHHDIVSSLCPVCLRTISGIVRETSDGVVLEKACPLHGTFRAIISSDLETYERMRGTGRKVTSPARYGAEVRLGCPDDCGLCSQHDQHTCLAILDITSRCDLECPVCLASSRHQGHDLDITTVERALQCLIRSEGHPTPLQLSGGEPTLHRDLEGVIQSAVALGFDRIEIDTNGLALGRDPFLAERLRDAGLSQVYLQMDGLDARVFEFIRGRDLLEEKLRAVENCRRAGVQVSLAVTVVPRVNDDCLWEMVRFAMDQGLTGVNFQAVALSGRFPKSVLLNQERLTLGHFLHKIEEQSGGRLLASDLLPLHSDPRCGALAYALIRDGELVPMTRIADRAALVDCVADISDWETVVEKVGWESPGECCCSACCSTAPIGADSAFLDAEPFSIGYHGMMDAYTIDLERARRCCVHALTPEGKLIPFCLHNIKYRQVT